MKSKINPLAPGQGDSPAPGNARGQHGAQHERQRSGFGNRLAERPGEKQWVDKIRGVDSARVYIAQSGKNAIDGVTDRRNEVEVAELAISGGATSGCNKG